MVSKSDNLSGQLVGYTIQILGYYDNKLVETYSELDDVMVT